jgi:hypothetical protein
MTPKVQATTSKTDKVDIIKVKNVIPVWWYMPIIPLLGRLVEKDHNFKGSLSYLVRPCLEKTKQNKTTHTRTHKKFKTFLDQRILSREKR